MSLLQLADGPNEQFGRFGLSGQDFSALSSRFLGCGLPKLEFGVDPNRRQDTQHKVR
jgi:hypothetical protein